MTGLFKHFKYNAYIYFLGIATAYMLFFLFYTFNSKLNAFAKEWDTAWQYLADISILFFTAGIFSVAVKYFQFLGVFEVEFNKAISSDKFDQKLKKQLTQITFSEEFLLQQSNLNEIWKKVTLCKYNKQFPELYHKLQKKIDNELFSEGNISYYYKNFQIHYSINTLEDKSNHIKIVERSSFTIVRPSNEKFLWDFGVTHLKTENQPETQSKLSFDIKNDDLFKFDKSMIKIRDRSEKLVNHYIEVELSDKKEYHIERCIELVQNLDDDKEFSFGSERIIDDISIEIEHGPELEIFFSTVNKNKMYENGAFDRSNTYINRDVFMPGEKFKIFINKKKN